MHTPCLSLIQQVATLCIFLGAWWGSAQAQISREVDPIICYTSEEVAPPQAYQIWAAKTDTQRSNFELVYTNTVPTQAQLALEYTVSLWGSIVSSDIPIRVGVTWDTLANNVLASAGPTSIFRNFGGATTPYWYPVALAEGITGQELNGSDVDLTLTLNSAINWYYGAQQQPGVGQYDFVTVMMHEVAHGLGFFSAVNSSGDTAELGFDGRLLVFEALMLDENNLSLSSVADYPNPSPELFDVLTSDSLFFDCPDAIAISGQPLQLYAPPVFRRGSTAAHLDEQTYPIGNVHALMTPNIAFQESNYNPEALTLCVFEEMGWDVTPLTTIPVSIREQDEQSWGIYPNPAQQWLHVKGNQLGREASYHIRDMSGRIMLEGRLEDLEAVSLQALSPGYYVISIRSDAQSPVSLPFVKQ